MSGRSLSAARSRRWVWASSMLTNPQRQALALVGELRSVGGDAVCHDAEGFRDGGEGVLRVPDLPVVEFVALWGCAEESRLVADGWR